MISDTKLSFKITILAVFLFTLIFTACNNIETNETIEINKEGSKTDVTIAPSQGITEYNIKEFFDKFNRQFGMVFSKSDKGVDSYEYYSGDKVNLFRITNKENFIENYADFFKFVEYDALREKIDIGAKIKDNLDRKDLPYELYYYITELGFSESIAIEVSYVTLYYPRKNSIEVSDAESSKKFYYYCAPNIIVKAEGSRAGVRGSSAGFSSFKVVGKKDEVLPIMKDQLKSYITGIRGYKYDSNSRAMREILCPELPKDFNKNFQQLSKEGML